MHWIADLAHDIRYGLRLIRKTPVLSIATILTLAVGIGLDAGVFTIIDGAVFRARVSEDPASFVQIGVEHTGAASAGLPYVSVRDYDAFRTGTRSLRDVAAWTPAPVAVGGTGEEATSGVALIVTCNFFAVYGSERPIIGRLFRSDECAMPGTAPVVVIGEDMWRTRYASDPAIVGTTLVLNRSPFTVIGVMPSGYAGQLRGPIWIPYTMVASIAAGRDLFREPAAAWLVMIGRLRPGYSRTAATADLSVVAAAQDRLVPGRKTTIRLTNGSLIEMPEMRSVAFWLVPLVMGALSLVVLLACGNVAMLLLSRAVARQHEIAVRISLGASRSRLVRMLLTDSLLLAVLSLPFALFLTYALPLIVRATVPSPPFPVRVDGVVIAYLAGVALLAGVAAGLAPARESLRRDVSASLHGQESMAGGGRISTRDLLVAGQVAMSLLLLAGAGLFVRAEYRLMSASPGYESDRVVLVAPRVAVPPYTREAAASLYRTLGERIASISGVRAVAYTNAPPLGGEELPATAETIRAASGAPSSATASTNVVSSSFFAALSVPVIRGQMFVDGQGEAAIPPAVVSESLARALFSDRDPVGQLIDLGSSRSARIVGVAADMATLSQRTNRVVYLPRTARTFGDVLLVRVDDDVRGVQKEVRGVLVALDPRISAEPRTLTSLREALASKFLRIVRMVLFLAVVALTLAMVGIYGVVSFAVGRRTREMGIRAALGATRRDIVALVLVSSTKPVVAGAVAGLGGAALTAQALARVFRNAPVPIDPGDPVAYGVVTAILLGVAGVAVLGPARRAASANPSDALRQD